MNGLTNLLLKNGPARIMIALGLTAVLAAVLFGVIFRMGGEEKALLFSGVDMKDASAMTAKLEQANIPYELRGDGSSIYVPRSKVLSARMMLSADGLPGRGSVGYEIFDKPDALGATQFMQNINRLRALEGELSRSIASLDGVAAARVHLVIPERQLFERDRALPSASIVLQLRRAELSAGEVRAIRNLVASATPGLSPQRVTILDETGALLAAAQEPGSESSVAGDGADSRQAAYEARVRKTVQDIVEGVVGPGAARVQVTAELDLNRITQESETFDPEGRVVRSTETTEDSTNSKDASAAAGASASRNLPDSGGGGGDSGGNSSGSTSTKEIVNYEISKTVKKELIEGGRLRKLSVAVAVDGVHAPGEGGAAGKYTPRSAEEMQRLAALVRSAVGYDEARGDKVEVVNVEFARPDIPGEMAEKSSMFSFQSSDLMRAGEIGAALVVALVMILFVLGPLARGLIGGGGQAGGGDMLAAPAGGGGGVAIASMAGQPPMAMGLPAPAMAEAEPLIDVARINGQVKASSVKKVAEVVEQHPDESVQIIRGWLSNAS